MKLEGPVCDFEMGLSSFSLHWRKLYILEEDEVKNLYVVFEDRGSSVHISGSELPSDSSLFLRLR